MCHGVDNPKLFLTVLFDVDQARAMAVKSSVTHVSNVTQVNNQIVCDSIPKDNIDLSYNISRSAQYFYPYNYRIDNDDVRRTRPLASG